MDATYAPAALEWDRVGPPLMRLHKMNDYIVITSKTQACPKALDIRQQVLQHGSDRTSVSASIWHKSLGSTEPSLSLPGGWEESIPVHKGLNTKRQLLGAIIRKCLAVEMKGTEPFLSHIKCIVRMRHSSFLLSLQKNRDAKCQVLRLFKLKGLAKRHIQKMWPLRWFF